VLNPASYAALDVVNLLKQVTFFANQQAGLYLLHAALMSDETAGFSANGRRGARLEITSFERAFIPVKCRPQRASSFSQKSCGWMQQRP